MRFSQLQNGMTEHSQSIREQKTTLRQRNRHTRHRQVDAISPAPKMSHAHAPANGVPEAIRIDAEMYAFLANIPLVPRWPTAHAEPDSTAPPSRNDSGISLFPADFSLTPTSSDAHAKPVRTGAQRTMAEREADVDAAHAYISSLQHDPVPTHRSCTHVPSTTTFKRSARCRLARLPRYHADLDSLAPMQQAQYVVDLFASGRRGEDDCNALLHERLLCDPALSAALTALHAREQISEDE